MKNMSEQSIEKHILGNYQTSDKLVDWLMNGDFGPDNVDRYGIQLFSRDTCVTTRVQKHDDTERFNIHIVTQKAIDFDLHEALRTPYLERDYEDEQWILLVEADIHDAKNLLTEAWYEDVQRKMEQLLTKH